MAPTNGPSGRIRAARVLLGGLRVRIGLAVLLAITGFALFVAARSAHELSVAYARAGRDEVVAIAATFSEDFRPSQVQRPQVARERLESLKRINPDLTRLALYRRDRGRGVVVASIRAEASDDGDLLEAGDLVPLDTGRPLYKEEHEDGKHLAEVNFPLRGAHSRPVAVLGLYFDLGPRDAALRAQTRRVALAALLTALLLALVLSGLLGRAVFAPLTRLRSAARRIEAGELGTRLGWRRSDELGAVARDFDAMAARLEENHDRLHELALRDALTGVLNHRAFHESLAAEVSRARREGFPVSLLAIDVDSFKPLNDTYGHAAGDEALRLLASVVRSDLRPSDVCARVGGDEFMVVLPNADSAAAAIVAERLRSAVASLRLSPALDPLTVSIGIAEYPRDAADQAALMRRADASMYWAKHQGGNRWSQHSGDAPPTSPPRASRERPDTLVHTVHALARAVDAKDGYTHQHSQRVSLYAVALAEKLRIDADRVRFLRTAGVLHDIGKVGVPDAILLKPGKLTADEFAAVKRHSEIGAEIVAGAGLTDVAQWILHLHERFDGAGYPAGLAGEDIPYESRLLAIADAFEAMTSPRIYRAPLTVDDALFELELGAGTQFDRAMVSAFLHLVREGHLPTADEHSAAPASPAPSAAS